MMSGPAIIIKLAGREIHLSARAAGACALALLAGVIGLLAWLVIEWPDAVKSSLSSPLWTSAGLWLLMIVYWNAKQKDVPRIRTGETAESRNRHQMLLYLA